MKMKKEKVIKKLHLEGSKGPKKNKYNEKKRSKLKKVLCIFIFLVFY
jgi:hypothetical protein